MKTLRGYDIEKVLNHFLTAGLWASCDNNDNNLDENYNIHDTSKDSQSEITKGIEKFIKENHKIIKRNEICEESLGHDLFLDSQGHGVGFWNRGYGNDGDILSEKSEEIFASDPPYIGDDNKIHFSNVKY